MKRKIFTLLVLLLFFASAEIFKNELLKVNIKKERINPRFYLPEPALWQLFFPQHHLLFSDLLQAQALTYYGSRYFQKEKDLSPLITLFHSALELDEENQEAFFLASNLLSAVFIHQAMAILQKGFTYHYLNWKFPEMIGFKFFFYLKNLKAAARYYEIASRLPGHPPFVASLSGKLYSEAGLLKKGLQVLLNFYNSTNDFRLKESFRQEIEKLQKIISTKD